MKVLLSILEFLTKSLIFDWKGVIYLENYFQKVLLEEVSEFPSRGLEVPRNFRGSSLRSL
jgi:hypothetical protein